MTKFYEILGALPLNSGLEITSLANLCCILYPRTQPDGSQSSHTDARIVGGIFTNVVQLDWELTGVLLASSEQEDNLPLPLPSPAWDLLKLTNLGKLFLTLGGQN